MNSIKLNKSYIIHFLKTNKQSAIRYNDVINQKRSSNSYLQNVRAYTTAKILNNNEKLKTLKEKILFTSTNHTDPVNNFAEKGQHKRHEKQAAKEILGYAI